MIQLMRFCLFGAEQAERKRFFDPIAFRANKTTPFYCLNVLVICQRSKFPYFSSESALGTAFQLLLAFQVKS
jgi:hypothetical protein